MELIHVSILTSSVLLLLIIWLIIRKGQSTTELKIKLDMLLEQQSHQSRSLDSVQEKQLHHFDKLANTIGLQSSNEQKKLLESLHTNHLGISKDLRGNLNESIEQIRKQLQDSLTLQTQTIDRSFSLFSDKSSGQLSQIADKLENKLSDGLEKNNLTFNQIIKRLTIIDEAQKRLAELSDHIVSLQDLFTNQISRGAIGETQLYALVKNMLPKQNYELQYTLSSGVRADCILFLPEPTGQVVVDSKFPLNNYRGYTNPDISTPEREKHLQQFKQDVKKHIKDIADKYIIPGETANGAMMFIPAESIFSEIISNHPALVDFAFQSKVYLTSPTTMMAILNTSIAVLQDEARRQQLNIIQKHLIALSADFKRFYDRMGLLKKHINQAQNDVENATISANKLISRFEKIERVELSEIDIKQVESEEQ